ncbi:hypothetical protein ACLOJK_003612 [Asimina triloba]
MSSQCQCENPSECMSRWARTEWPELVGVSQDMAELSIEKANSEIDAIPIVKGTPVPDPECNCCRVWLWVDKLGGTVVEVPRVG